MLFSFPRPFVSPKFKPRIGDWFKGEQDLVSALGLLMNDCGGRVWLVSRFSQGKGRLLGEPWRGALTSAWASERESFLEGMLFQK